LKRCLMLAIGEIALDKDRIVGAAPHVKSASRVTGDAKTQAGGAAEKAAGKVQNMVAGAKGTVPKTIKK